MMARSRACLHVVEAAGVPAAGDEHLCEAAAAGLVGVLCSSPAPGQAGRDVDEVPPHLLRDLARANLQHR